MSAGQQMPPWLQEQIGKLQQTQQGLQSIMGQKQQVEMDSNEAEKALDRAGMTCNKNGVPGDPEKPTVTSGIRIGTPAATTRGFGTEEFRRVGNLIGDVLDGLAFKPNDNFDLEKKVRQIVAELCRRFPIYSDN